VSDPQLLFLVRHGRADYTSTTFRETPRGQTFDPPLDRSGLDALLKGN